MRSFHHGVFQRLTHATAAVILLLLLLIDLLEGAPVSHLARQQLQSAVCADNTPGYFFMATNDSSSDFVVYLQGGPACAHNETLCWELLENDDGTSTTSASFFSSKRFPDMIAAYGLLSDDPEENPLYSSYNRVYVPYCTMDMFILDTEASDGSFFFRGRPFLEETLRTVLREAANKDATLVLAGSSAGAVGAFNIVNWVLDEFDQVTEISAILDSASFFYARPELGVWMDYFSTAPEEVTYNSATCLEEFGDGPCCLQLGCMLQRSYYPISDTRLRGTLALSSSQDALDEYEVDELIGQSSKPRLMWGVASNAGRTKSSLRNLANVYPETFSVFSPSCTDQQLLTAGEADLYECLFLEAEGEIGQETMTCEYAENGQLTSVAHRGSWDVGLRWWVSRSVEAWDNIQINGISIQSAMQRWWNGRGDASTQIALFDTCKGINCNPSCFSAVLPGSREKTDGPLVWTIVLGLLAVAVLVLAGGLFLATWGWLQWRRAKNIAAMRVVEGRERAVDPETDAVDASLDPSALRQSARRGLDEDDATPVLEWRSLSYWASQQEGYLYPWIENRPPSKCKQLLFEVEGAVPEGALCAIMGPRGCGKSTLLQLLAGRTSSGRYEGDVCFEGSPIAYQQKDSYKLKSGYIRGHGQSFVDSISVFDNLVFAAMLRKPGALEEKVSRVERVLDETALGHSRNELAGRLSPGQKLCLSLALELLNDRRILFIDEPAYDPDATASVDFIAILKRLSKKVTIVMAVRHLRPETMKLFTHALVIEDGKTVFCGPINLSLGELGRDLPDATSTNDVLLGDDDHRGNLSDTRFHSNSSTLRGALSSLPDGGSVHFASELASTVDAVGAPSRSDVPYSYDSAYGNYHGINSNGHGKFHSNGSTTSDRYPSRFNDLSTLFAGTLWTPGAARIGATAKLSGSEPGGILRHHLKPSGAGSSCTSNVSGMWNARPVTPHCASIPGGLGSASDSRDHRHRTRFSRTESGFSTHVDPASRERGFNSCAGSSASTVGCRISRTPRDGVRDFGCEDVIEAKDSTDDSSFSPTFSSSSTNAAAVVEERDGVTDGSRDRSKGGRSVMAASALVGGERKQEVQKRRFSGDAWGGSYRSHGDRHRGSGKGSRYVDRAREFGAEPALIGASELEFKAPGSGSVGKQSGGRDKLPPRMISHRTFSDKISDATGIVDHDLLAKVHAAATERSRAPRQHQQRETIAAKRGSTRPTAASKTPEKDPKRWKLARMPTPVPPSFFSSESGEHDELRFHENRRTSGKRADDSGLDPNHGGLTGGSPWDGEEQKRQKTASWKVTAVLIARSGASGYAREILWRFVALDVAAVFVASIFLAHNWREWGEFYMSLSVLLTMTMPVLFVYHPVMIANMRESWLLMRMEIADGFYSPACGMMRVVFDHLAMGVLGSFSAAGIMHVVVWRRFTSELPVSIVGVHAQLCCGVMLAAWAMIALFGSLATSGLRLTTASSMGACLCAGWAFFSGVIVRLPSLLPVLKVLTLTSPFYWSSSFSLRVLLDGLDRSERCNHRRLLGCALRFGDVVVDDLGLHVHPTGTFLVVTGLFVVAGLALLSIMIAVKGCRPGILGGTAVRAKISYAGRDGSVVEGVDKKNEGGGTTGSEDGGSGNLKKHAVGVLKTDIETKREKRVYRDYNERSLLRKISWPKFISSAVTNQVPGSVYAPNTADTAAAAADAAASASSSSFSFESYSPPASANVSPDGGKSPVPLLPSVAATRITAEALARFEKGEPPLSFDRGAGAWTSSDKGLSTETTGSVDEPTRPVQSLRSTTVNSSPNTSHLRSRSSVKPIAMDRITGSPRMAKERESAPPTEPEATNSSGLPGSRAHDSGIMSGDSCDADQDSHSALSHLRELTPTMAAVGTGTATARMMARATSSFSDRKAVRGGNPPASRSSHRQPHRVHFSLQEPSSQQEASILSAPQQKREELEEEEDFNLRQSSQNGGTEEEKIWAPVRGRPSTPKRRHGKRQFSPLLPPSDFLVSGPERLELAARKHSGPEQVLSTPKFARERASGYRTAADESPLVMVSPLRLQEDDFESNAGGLIASVPGRSTSVSVARAAPMKESQRAGYIGAVAPPSE